MIPKAVSYYGGSFVKGTIHRQHETHELQNRKSIDEINSILKSIPGKKKPKPKKETDKKIKRIEGIVEFVKERQTELETIHEPEQTGKISGFLPSEKEEVNPIIQDHQVRHFEGITIETIINFLTTVSFIILPFLLVYVSVIFFTTDASTFQAKLLIGLLNAIPEITALSVLYIVRELFKRTGINQVGKWFAIVGLMFIYLFLNVQSYIARVGYVISEVQKGSVVVNNQNNKIDQSMKIIQAIDLEIANVSNLIIKAPKFYTNDNDVSIYRGWLTASNESLIERRGKFVMVNTVQKVSTVYGSYVAIAKMLFNMNPMILFTFSTSCRMFSLDLCAIMIILGFKGKKKTEIVFSEKKKEENKKNLPEEKKEEKTEEPEKLDTLTKKGYSEKEKYKNNTEYRERKKEKARNNYYAKKAAKEKAGEETIEVKPDIKSHRIVSRNEVK